MPLVTAQNVVGEAPAFIEAVLEELKRLKVNVCDLLIDHVCCRAGSAEDYQRLRREFSHLGELLTEADVNGRPIATFKLHAPLRVEARRIFLVEIPAPKPGKNYATGLEHCEFVTPDDFEIIIASAPTLPWDRSGMTKAGNAELVLPLQHGRCVKFHHQSLEVVIEAEKKALACT